jgi:hypothetical protein
VGLAEGVRSGRVRVAGQVRATTFTGTVTGERISLAVPASFRSAADRLGLTTLDLAQAAARVSLSPQGLDLIDLRGTGPDLAVSGAVHIEDGGRSTGRFVVVGQRGPTTTIPIVFGPATPAARRN